LGAVGLSAAWASYQKTQGFPLKYQQTAKCLLDAFFLDPEYTAMSSRRSYGDPLPLHIILSNYGIDDSGICVFKEYRKSNCHSIVQTSDGVLSLDVLLKQIGYVERFASYELSVGLPRDDRDKARAAVLHFLQNPSYSKWRYGLGSPRNITGVFRDCSIKNSSMVRNHGDCFHMYRSLRNANFPPDRVPGLLGLDRVWKDYEASSATNPFVFDIGRYPELVPFIRGDAE
jgi:hypothetical protein